MVGTAVPAVGSRVSSSTKEEICGIKLNFFPAKFVIHVHYISRKMRLQPMMVAENSAL
jgi:hypothetical protein